MHIIVIGYLFVILMVSITYYPDIPAMLLHLFGLGIVPVWLWIRMMGFIQAKPPDPSRSETPSGRTRPGADTSKNADPP
jgi:hypothetical protein